MTTMTRKFRRETGPESNSPFYGYYVRLSGQARKDYATVQAMMTKRLGGVPSNPMLLDELMRIYLATPSDAVAPASGDFKGASK